MIMADYFKPQPTFHGYQFVRFFRSKSKLSLVADAEY